GLRQAWPSQGPPVLWEKRVGAGLSGPVVAGTHLILFHRLDDREVVACLDAATGAERWPFPYPTAYTDGLGVPPAERPRATPVIASGRVYTLGAEGRLHCLDLETGKKVWARDVNTDYAVPKAYFGVGTSPLLEGNLLLVNVGGRGAGIVAFDKDTGKEVW